MKNIIKDRFLKYVGMDTQSDENSQTCPSTEKQLVLLRTLYHELIAMGLSDVSMDSNGYVMGTLPANNGKTGPAIGFVAHVDTSPDMPGNDIKPRLVENYDGGDVLLNQELNLVLSPRDFPEMKQYAGQTLIVTDGTTLLGADDKAGITEIMTAIEYLVNHPEIKHGPVKIAFTPDEEIGRGVDHFDVKKFGADWAYTMDGGEIGELEYENFNAASAKVNIQGRNIHPGYAKGKMQNALLMAMEFNALLPVFDRPEFTQDYEGFFHLIKSEGSVEKAVIQYIIRDHDRNLFEKRKETMQQCADFMNRRYGEGCFDLEMKDQYYNMREMVEPQYHIVETARKAMVALGIEPKIKPIRGGTDGSRLSYMGLPCPNIFAGGHNFHGKFEFVPLESMEKATQVILKIIEMNA
ncbi:MAG: peptidase T [Lentimicrobiaceae bacterium]|jgi:tripeptide aminopeptidase|nr:peptidase T [Lentimicrobiaceae bacterium]MDD4599140.1 peptidase T [Lentimicrobiaceae bacterium]MDY0025330.1 peptidase T [Lentimicrobium sp.]HAH57075.1 peptidase T [Bacteroidales bacterium]